MVSADLISLEAAIDRLSASDQLWLMERLARRLRERSGPVPDPREQELEEMAKDPAIQGELREIAAEFAAADSDGLEATS